MDIFYQIGIFVGLILVGLALHIFKGCHKSGYPSNITNFTFSISISTAGVLIIIASLAAIQPHNWYTSSQFWKMLIMGQKKAHIMATENYITQKYDQPTKVAIWFANPYIPWHDPEVPGGKLGEELIIQGNGQCSIQTMVSNGQKRKSIAGRPTETVTIASEQAQELLMNILTVLNYIATAKTNQNTRSALRETTIYFADNSNVTFCDYEDDDNMVLYKLSMSIRNALNRADLMALDGNSHEDFIDKLEIKYNSADNYTEKLTLNRNKETITYLRKQGPKSKVSSTYSFDDQVSRVLDNLNPIDFTTTIPGLPKNVIDDSSNLGHFQCKIIRRKLEPLTISGDYEQYELPETWDSLMKVISEMINLPAIGIIPDANYYERKRRCKDDYIYLTVNFAPSSKKYNYLTNDDSIQIGDWVLVPTGPDNHLHECLVIDKNYYKKDEVPYPLSKIKKVAKKVDND